MVCIIFLLSSAFPEKTNVNFSKKHAFVNEILAEMTYVNFKQKF